MKSYWRFGLILLVVLVACSDKKAEQAASLKTEIEAQLAKAAGPDKKMLTYGDVTVTPEAPLSEAAKIMIEKKIGCVVVVEGKKIVGILTEGDFVKLSLKE